MEMIAHQLQHARTALTPVAGANAALEARLLAAHAWGMSAEALILCGNEARDAAAFAALVERRLMAEPVAQIVGSKAFWKDEFKVTSAVLTPRADSETMIETLLRLRPDTAANYRLLDLGTGSGCLMLSALREYVQATGVAVDQSAAALAVAGANAVALGFASRVEMLQGDWCSNVTGNFDIILSNPPYIPTGEIAALDADVRVHEPMAALDGGVDGLDCYRLIVQQVATHAKPGSLLLFEVGMDQHADVAAIAAAQNWKLLDYAKDLAGIARVVALEFNPND